ncbi:hypothetical protein [Stakelama tenebrarum]|uniref:Uncharacterized protein n=1 Tax=Stakelama tenebrarum TaxID=2711215 RepID=A0A6G6Y3L7_9SPHN|nr:hypothetical protein [Sphingosinithalassobacter tenebrarum]QIG79441.1 hypothetical protein G5C33_06330 [Sphingosinithalassobacter tenebrarum]
MALTALLAKGLGGGFELIGEVGASIETGVGRREAGTLIARGVIGVVPFADDVVGALAGEAAEAMLPQTNIPRVCE